VVIAPLLYTKTWRRFRIWSPFFDIWSVTRFWVSYKSFVFLFSPPILKLERPNKNHSSQQKSSNIFLKKAEFEIWQFVAMQIFFFFKYMVIAPLLYTKTWRRIQIWSPFFWYLVCDSIWVFFEIFHFFIFLLQFWS
jgi:hypothetical protein